jgi:nucleoside-diphosphate-sugar epimerase
VKRLLVLGGTSFVGRTIVTEAVDRGWSVTTFNRGRAAWTHPAADRITGDRTVSGDLERLRHGQWEAVVDTWAGAPRIVRDSTAVLRDRVQRYLYISSRAVYATPMPRDMDENAATVSGSIDAEATSYGQNKRGSELAVESAFGEGAVLARAGPIVGPHEDLGRLPFWLLRIAAGGPRLAPGPPDLPWRFIDVRDLAIWLLHAVTADLSGPFNLVGPEGHATTRSVLEAAIDVTGSDAELVWVDQDSIKSCGIDRWQSLPGWVPPEPDLAGLIWTNTARAENAGLICRPVLETVADTWEWVVARGGSAPSHPDHPHALDRAVELRVMAPHLV